MSKIYINAEGHVLGRLASHVAKLLLKGNEVYVVNTEKIVITGKWKVVLEEWRHRILERGDWIKGPFYPKRPDRIFKRVVRGMLPKNSKGREIFKKLHTYIGIPEELVGQQFISFKDSLITEKIKNSKRKIWYVELGNLAKHLGAKF